MTCRHAKGLICVRKAHADDRSTLIQGLSKKELEKMKLEQARMQRGPSR